MGHEVSASDLNSVLCAFVTHASPVCSGLEHKDESWEPSLEKLTLVGRPGHRAGGGGSTERTGGWEGVGFTTPLTDGSHKGTQSGQGGVF